MAAPQAPAISSQQLPVNASVKANPAIIAIPAQVHPIAATATVPATATPAAHESAQVSMPALLNVEIAASGEKAGTLSLPSVAPVPVAPTAPRTDPRPTPPLSISGLETASMTPVPGAQRMAVPQASTEPLATTPPAVADQIIRAFVDHAGVVARQGSTDFHLRLEPPNLGTVHIYVSATESSVSVRVVAAHEGTQALLENQSHDLRQSLAQAGVALGGFDVTRDGSGSSGSRQQPQESPALARQSGQLATQRTSVATATPVLNGINFLA
jgi:flagellar hook-length control protein FliK